MRLYRKDATCPKCSHKKVSALFRAADPINPHPDLRADHLLRECTHCHFSWPERPMDQATSEEMDLLIDLTRAKAQQWQLAEREIMVAQREIMRSMLDGASGSMGSSGKQQMDASSDTFVRQMEIEAKLWPPIS